MNLSIEPNTTRWIIAGRCFSPSEPMLFNEYAKNYDDHTKNIAFLMNKKGEWSLAPAYDMTFSYRKGSPWVSAHQMLINGKAEDIIIDDLLAVAEKAGIKQSNAKSCIEQVKTAVSEWTRFAEETELSDAQMELPNGGESR